LHITIHFLAAATDIDDAVSQVEGFLEPEKFFDYFTVLKEQSGTLDEKRAELLEWQAKYDWKKTADDCYATAEVLKAQGNICMAGYYYRKAGSLYEQLLTDDATVYNINKYDYSIPADGAGLVNDEKWFCVPVDFHV
jgi:hypothetical protein